MGEAKERLGVGGHGTADVDEQDEASCPGLPVDIADGGHLAAGRHHASQRAGPVGTSPSGDPVATGGANLSGLGEGGREQPQERGVQGRQLTQVALSQALDPTGQGQLEDVGRVDTLDLVGLRTAAERAWRTGRSAGLLGLVASGAQPEGDIEAIEDCEVLGRRAHGRSTRPVHAEGIARIEEIDGLKPHVHAIGRRSHTVAAQRPGHLHHLVDQVAGRGLFGAGRPAVVRADQRRSTRPRLGRNIQCLVYL